MTNIDSGNGRAGIQGDGAIRVAPDEKTGIEVEVKKTKSEASVTASSGGEQGGDKILEEKVDELKETARKRVEEVGKMRRQIAECTGRILASDKQMPDNVKEFFLDRLWPQLEVMSSRNGLFLVRDGGFYFNETVQVATKWLKTIEKAAALADSANTEEWNKFMASGMPNAIKGSLMMDTQFWGLPSNGVVDTSGVPTFEKIAKEELGKKK